MGEPDFGYPERWSVVRWLVGDVPTVANPESDAAPTRLVLARDLATVVSALRDIAVPHRALTDPALRWYRGAPLRSLDDSTRGNLAACRAIPDLDLDVTAALHMWDETMALPEPEQASTPRWYHGDLLAENLLVRDHRLSAVLDFGGLAVGDPTVDLVVAWELLDASSREIFRRTVGVDDASWQRGRAWALALALMTFPYYWRTMPDRCASRLTMARAALIDGSREGECPQ